MWLAAIKRVARRTANIHANQKLFTNNILGEIRFASCMAPNADDTCRQMAAYFARVLGVRTVFVDDVSWQERERLFDAGDIHVCWLCGLPYVWKADASGGRIELLAAPVMRDARYAGRAEYFSDVVVHAASRFASFADLRGASWAYNEPNSHSGFGVVQHHLARLGQRKGYFGRVVESGAHQHSLRMIAQGTVDASAIDSTVFAAECARTPGLRERLRVIDTLGPSPMPPWVMRCDLPHSFRQLLRGAFLNMHLSEAGRHILRGWGIARMSEVHDTQYDVIRRMACEGEGVVLALAA